jgi:hypothetical protein
MIDANFPMSEWDRLLPQTILTLNLLRSSRAHPSISAHTSLFGNYDFNRVPIAPPGTKVVSLMAAEARTKFGEHGKVGWYIGPSPEHYRCYKCYSTDTMKECDVLTVDFFPEKKPSPKFTQEDYLKQTAKDMLHLLTAPTTSPTATPLSFGPPILKAYAKIADILPTCSCSTSEGARRISITSAPIYAKQLQPAHHKQFSPSLISNYQCC